jgi:hypothetical protein
MGEVIKISKEETSKQAYIGSAQKRKSNHMTRSPKLHFNHLFILYYIVYAYKCMIFG